MAEIKDKKAMINDGKNIELDGVTIINEGISLAEIKKEEPKEEVTPVASDEPVIPANAQEVQVEASGIPTPEISPIDIPVAPVDLPIGPIGVDLPERSVSNDPTYDYSQPQFQTEPLQPSFDQASVVGTNDFNSSYDSVSYEKVETTIVTKDDAKLARDAYLSKAAELYDMGPGKQIGTLMEAASKMDELLKEVDTQGFVSGPNHEAIKRGRLAYRGLKEIDNNRSYSDPEGPSLGGMNY